MHFINFCVHRYTVETWMLLRISYTREFIDDSKYGNYIIDNNGELSRDHRERILQTWENINCISYRIMT